MHFDTAPPEHLLHPLIEPRSRSTLHAPTNCSNAAPVDVRTVAGLIGIPVLTVWRRTRSEKLPAPRKIGAATRRNVAELRVILTANANNEC